MVRQVILSAVAAVALASGAMAQEAGGRENWVEFIVPALSSEKTDASVIDLSFLNPEPAGARGFLKAQGEQIVDGQGNVMRLFGSNICDFHPMPPKELAPRIAKRIKQLGMNFVRFHYFDWAKAPEGLMKDDMQGLDPVKLDQMDYLLAQLKENGIYVDLNLHVARGYPGLPKGWDRMGKGIDYVHEPFIQSQLQFARDLLTHVNPHTGNTYAQEPAIALIEFNNENTVMTDTVMSQLAGLDETFTRPLQTKWIAYLKQRYGSTEALRQAWNVNPQRGPNLLRNADLKQGLDEWKTESAAGAEADALVVQQDGRAVLKWTTKKAGQQPWNLQLMQTSIPVEHGKTYTLSFTGRSPTKTPLTIGLMMQAEPWAMVGGAKVVALNETGKKVELCWTVSNPTQIPSRLNLSAENKVGEFELSEISLREGEPEGLREGETLEAGNIPIMPTSARQMADLQGFYHRMEKEYVQRMQKLIREEIGSPHILMNTQANYGGAAGVVREASFADVGDVHCYPAHPSGGGQGWTRAVRQVSLADDAFNSSIFPAEYRLAGKPMLCTEFDLNPPNDHAAECFPFMAIIGAYQGFSGMLDYSWLNFQKDYDPKRLHSSFSTTGHAGQMAMVPAASLMFRQGMITPAPAKGRITVTVPGNMEPMPAGMTEWGAVPGPMRSAGVPVHAAFMRSLAVAVDPAAKRPSVSGDVPASSKRIVSDTGEIVLDHSENGAGRMTVNTPSARCVFGRIAGKKIGLGDASIEVAAGAFGNYANIAIVALDGKPISASQKVLITALNRVENRDMIWNETRTAVKWGNGPTVAETVTARITVPGDGWKATLLDGNGQRMKPAEMSGSTLSLREGAYQPWVLLER